MSAGDVHINTHYFSSKPTNTESMIESMTVCFVCLDKFISSTLVLIPQNYLSIFSSVLVSYFKRNFICTLKYLVTLLKYLVTLLCFLLASKSEIFVVGIR